MVTGTKAVKESVSTGFRSWPGAEPSGLGTSLIVALRILTTDRPFVG